MIKKILRIVLISLCIIFPILSVEDIVLWIIALVFIHKSCKVIGTEKELYKITLNTLICGGIILTYNIVARYVEEHLVKLFI